MKMNKKLMFGTIAFLLILTAIDLAYAMEAAGSIELESNSVQCSELNPDEKELLSNVCDTDEVPTNAPESATIGTGLAIAGIVIYAGIKNKKKED